MTPEAGTAGPVARPGGSGPQGDGQVAAGAAPVGRAVRLARGGPAVAALLEAAGPLVDHAGTPFCARTPGLSAWDRCFRGRPPPVAVFDHDRPVGLAGLAVHRKGPLCTVTLAGHGPSDY